MGHTTGASAASSTVNQLMFTTGDPSSIVTTATEVGGTRSIAQEPDGDKAGHEGDRRQRARHTGVHAHEIGGGGPSSRVLRS